MDTVLREAARRDGRDVDESAAAAQVALLRAQVEEQSHPYYLSAHCVDDGVIDPRDTRNVIGLCLEACYSNVVRGTTSWGVHRM